MNEETRINFDGLNDCIVNWKTINDSFDTECSGKFATSFKGFNLADSCVKEIENAIEAITEFTSNEQSYFSRLINILSPQANNPGTSGKHGTSGAGGIDNVSAGAPGDIYGGEEIGDAELLGIVELEEIGGELLSLALLKNLTLEELLADDKYSDEIKKAILDSQNVSDSLKEIISQMDSSVARQFIAAMLNKGESDLFELSDLNMSILFNYLSVIASNNGTTVENLLKQPQYAKLLRNALSNCKDATYLYAGWDNLSGEEIQENLLAVYNGDVPDELSKGSIEVTRGFIETLVDQSSVPYEELLTDASYAGPIKEATTQFQSATDFFGLLSQVSNSEMSGGILNNLTNI